MSKVKVYPFFKNPYLISRNMADNLLKNYSEEVLFDFDRIDFVSAAFADEFIRKVPISRITNAPENVIAIFKAVSNR